MKHLNGGIATAALPRFPWSLPPGTLLGLRRGVVTAVHWPDDATNQSKSGFEVDVLFYDRTWQPNIPVASYLGAGDCDTRTPQPTFRTKDEGTILQYEPGDPASTIEWVSELATPVNELDGDHVIVGFFRGQAAQPVVLGFQAHPNRLHPTAREYAPPSEDYHHGKATGFARQMRHAGAAIGIDEGGNIYLDASSGGWPNDDPDREPAGPKRRVYVQAGNDGAIILRAGEVSVDVSSTGMRFRAGNAPLGKAAEAGAVSAELSRIMQRLDALSTWAMAQSGTAIPFPPSEPLGTPGSIASQQCTIPSP